MEEIYIMKNQIPSSSKYLLSLPRYVKRIIVLLVDGSFCILTIWFSFYIILEEFIYLSGNALWSNIISIAIALPIFLLFGLHRSLFRYSGWPVILITLKALITYGIIFASIVTAVGIPNVPRTIGIIQPFLLFLAIGSSRLLAAYWLGGVYKDLLSKNKPTKALVFGVGHAGQQLVSALENSGEIRVVGFLDDDKSIQGSVLNGKPIFSVDEIQGLISLKGISHIFLALPSVSLQKRN